VASINLADELVIFANIC